MGLINIYRGLSNEHKTINATGKICDILPDYDFSHSVIIKAGNKLDSNYFVENDDVIFLRATPSGTTAAAVVAIVIAVVAVGAAVGAGIYANKMNAETEEKMKKAQRDAENLASKTEALPFLKGAQNKRALGSSVQYLIGEMYNTPYKLTDGFYSIGGTNGSKQYWNVILSLGYGYQLIKSLLIGNEKIAENPDGLEGVGSFKPDSVFYDPENKYEIAQNGADFTLDYFNSKVISTQDGSEIKHEYGHDAEPLIKQVADHTQKLEVCIQFNALRRYNTDSSAWENRAVKINPYWSNDNGDTWNLFYFNGVKDNTFNFNTNRAIRFTATKEFSKAEVYGKDILLKLVRTTPKLESNSNEDAYLLYYQSYCYDNKKSADASELVTCAPLEDDLKNKCTRLGLRIIANDSTKDTLDEIHVIASGVARTWDGEKWSDEKTATRNPASWILEILTSDVHAHSKYNIDEIDALSFGELYEYCEKNNLFTDYILIKADKKRTILSSILSTIGADLIINNEGLLSIALDKIEPVPVALLNSQNLKNVTVAKSFERKADGLKVTFTNRDSWEIDTFYSMLDGEEREADDVITELALDYVTTYEHAYKIAQRRLRQQTLQPREVKVGVGNEGDYYPLYSVVLLQLEQLRAGLASSVVENVELIGGYLTQIEIGDTVNFEAGKRYGVIIQAQSDAGYRHIYAEVRGTGKTRTLELVAPIPYGPNDILPQYGNILSFGYLNDDGTFNRVTNKMKITGIEPDGDEGYTLTLKDYNPAIYETGEIPPYRSNLTSTPQAGRSLDTVTPEMLQKVEDKIVRYNVIVEYSIDGESWHNDYSDDDVYKRTSYDGGESWTTSERIRGESGENTYILDVTPDYIAVPCDENGIIKGSTEVNFYCFVYYGPDELRGFNFTAYIDGVEVGTWNDNKLTLTADVITSDNTEVVIIATKGDTVRQATAVISKLYGADSAKIYKMLLSETTIKKSSDGVLTPNRIKAEKRVIDSTGENVTEAGYITVTANTSTEEKPQGYEKIEPEAEYDAEAEYNALFMPLMLSDGRGGVLAESHNTAGVFFTRTNSNDLTKGRVK